MTEKLFWFFVLLLWFGINHHWNHIHSPSTCLRLKQMPKAMFKDEKELKSNGPKECVCIKFVHITKIINHLSYWHVNHIPSPFSNTHTRICVHNSRASSMVYTQYAHQNQLVMPICISSIAEQTNRIESLTNELKIHVGTRQIMGFLTSVWLLFGFLFYFHD